jgi:hypothetical protein
MTIVMQVRTKMGTRILAEGLPVMVQAKKTEVA